MKKILTVIEIIVKDAIYLYDYYKVTKLEKSIAQKINELESSKNIANKAIATVAENYSAMVISYNDLKRKIDSGNSAIDSLNN